LFGCSKLRGKAEMITNYYLIAGNISMVLFTEKKVYALHSLMTDKSSVPVAFWYIVYESTV